MSTVNQDELKAIKVLKFEGKESEWECWSEKFIALARARGCAGILLGTEQAPNADEEIDRKKADGSYVRELDLAMCVSPSSNGSKMRILWTNQMKS